jgi:hypothetical protein
MAFPSKFLKESYRKAVTHPVTGCRHPLSGLKFCRFFADIKGYQVLLTIEGKKVGI